MKKADSDDDLSVAFSSEDMSAANSVLDEMLDIKIDKNVKFESFDDENDERLKGKTDAQKNEIKNKIKREAVKR